MKKLLLVLFLSGVVVGAQTAGYAIGHVYTDFESGAPDAALTATDLNNATVQSGDIGTWSIVGGTSATGAGSKQITADSEYDMDNRVKVGSTVYGDEGDSRGVRVDMQNDSSYFVFNFTDDQTFISGSCLWTPGWGSDTSDRIHANSTLGRYFVPIQTDLAGNAHAHGTATIDEGAEIELRDTYPGETFRVVFWAQAGVSGTTRIYRHGNGDQFIGESTVPLDEPASWGLFTQIRFGGTDGRTGIEYSDRYDDIIIKVGVAEEIQRGTVHVATVANGGSDAAGRGAPGFPYATPDYAADRATPGQLIIVAPGTYGALSPAVDGTATDPITFFGNNKGAIIQTTETTAANMSNRDYLRFFEMTFDAQWVSADATWEGINAHDATFIEVWNSEIKGYTRAGFSQDTGGNTTRGDNAILIGNSFPGATDGRTEAIGGQSRSIKIRGDHNLVAYNISPNNFEDFVYFFGSHNRFLNNYAYNFRRDTVAETHTDMFQNGANPGMDDNYTLLEANIADDNATPTDHHHFGNLENSELGVTHILMRRNVTRNIGTYNWNVFDNVANVYLVNETYALGNRFQPTANYGVSLNINNGRSFHNIFYQIWGDSVTSAQVLSFGGTGGAGERNLYFDKDGSITFINQASAASEPNSLRNSNPLFVDLANLDLRIQSGSPAIAHGRGFTTVTSGGTGTSFTVADAGFFRGDDTTLSQYGGNLVVGDTITVGTDTVQIASISGNTITTTTSFTSANGEAVYWGSSTTPDLGAYPYSADPLRPSGTYADDGDDSGAVGEVFTIEYTGAARWIIVYERPSGATAGKGIVMEVKLPDSPMTYARQLEDSAIAVDFAPLYADTQMLVAATEGGGGGEPPGAGVRRFDGGGVVVEGGAVLE